MIENKIEGLIAAPFTPMEDDGSINANIIKDYASKLKNDGVSGVFICGTTGEGMLLSSNERKLVTESWINEQSENFKVIVHVGTTSYKTSKKLAQHAQEIGAYAFGCMAPVFLKPKRIEELVGFCAEVANGAKEIPFYYYHIPSISGVNFLMNEFIEIAKYQIPNFRGVKFTDNNLMDLFQCLQIDDGRWDILHGYDELLLAGLAFGANGAIGSTYNFMAPLYNSIIENFRNGNIDEARKNQAFSIKVIKILNNYEGAIVAGKALMKSIGIDCGNCRLPLKTLGVNEYEKMKNELDDIGFYKYLSL